VPTTPYSPAGGTTAHSVLTSHNTPMPTTPYSPGGGTTPQCTDTSHRAGAYRSFEFGIGSKDSGTHGGVQAQIRAANELHNNALLDIMYEGFHYQNGTRAAITALQGLRQPPGVRELWANDLALPRRNHAHNA
jgi:hypothetical protein